MKELLEAIDAGISNAYKVIDGDHDTLHGNQESSIKGGKRYVGRRFSLQR